MYLFFNRIQHITGGSGSFDNAELRRFVDTEIKKSATSALSKKTGRYAESIPGL